MEVDLITSVIISVVCNLFFFFFQAEDGIRDRDVTGVQTCALPICAGHASGTDEPGRGDRLGRGGRHRPQPDPRSGRDEIGRASCRERV